MERIIKYFLFEVFLKSYLFFINIEETVKKSIFELVLSIDGTDVSNK
jgi:hypothetical protein